MQFQAFAPTNVVAAPARDRRMPRTPFTWDRVMHLDVLLPAVAALLVLIVLLAWGA